MVSTPAQTTQEQNTLNIDYDAIRSMAQFPVVPTDEQCTILYYILNGANIIKVNAFAGTGKTSLLLCIAELLNYLRMMYLAFNKSIEVEASKKFKKNVTVKTTHSLAFYYVVIRNGYKIRDSNYKAIEIAEMFNIDYAEAQIVLKIFENYCNSSAVTIDFEDDERFLKRRAYELFQKMQNKEIEITHSFYLKMFQLMLLNNPNMVKPVDVLMLDEAQDTNDVTLSIFYSLLAKIKIIVGDKHQQIYSFRGSVNAMKKVKAYVFNLTQSFRFHHEIAQRATTFLRNFKLETAELKGIDKQENPEIKTEAFITRTNAKLIDFISNLVIHEKKFFKTVRDPYLIFGLTLNLIRLKKDEELDKGFKYLYSFKYDYERSGRSHDNILSYIREVAEEAEDKELTSAIKVINNHGENVIISLYKTACENFESDKECNIFLTTAHAAKGLEWDRVTLADDFDLPNTIARFIKDHKLTKVKIKNYLDFFVAALKSNKVDQKYIDELNLYYVAITRARHKVIDYTGLYDDLENFDREKFSDKIKAFVENGSIVKKQKNKETR